MAGQGYRLFNTGDVLTAAQVNTYLQEQVVMVFASAAARTTALSGVLAEGMMSYLTDTDVIQYYSGTSWVTVNTDQTPLTTKGDLFTYSTQDARLAVGSNGDTLVADSAATTGLRWSSTPAASNPVINGAMDIWQRGTTFAISNTSAYTADRWQGRVTSACTTSYSRQTTSDTTNLPNIQYCIRVQRANGQTATPYLILEQSFESVNSIPFAGKSITLSFYARAGANFSGASSQLAMQLYSGTGTDQNINGAYTGSATVINQLATLTTTWQRFSYTGTVASTATELAISMLYLTTGTAGAADYFEVTGLQIDIGSVALPFRRAMNTLAGELAACQRYYFKKASGSASTIGSGAFWSTSLMYTMFDFPVEMRTTPVLDATSGTNYYRYAVNGGSTAFNSFSLDGVTNSKRAVLTTSGLSGTIGWATMVYSDNASGSVALSAEL